MSQLQRTIIIPPGNPDPVLQSKNIKFMIVVNNPDLAEIADNMALDSPAHVDRYVLWYKTPDWGNLMKMFPGLPSNASGVQAFVLSPQNEVADIIHTNEDADYVRVGVAYAKAGLPKL